MKDKKENQQFFSNNSAKIRKRDDYIHIPIYKDCNYILSSVSVYLTDYKIIRELIADYAEVNKKSFIEFFIQRNVEHVLGSIELKKCIQK